MRYFKRMLEPRSRTKHTGAVLALLTLFAIVVGFIVVPNAADRKNEREAKAEKARVTAALERTHAAVVKDVMRLAASPSDAFPSAEAGSLDKALRIDADHPDSISILAGTSAERSDLDRALIDFIRPISEGSARSTGGMLASGDLFDVFATAVSAPQAGDTRLGPPKIIIGLRQVGSAYLNQVADLAHVDNLELIHRASDTIAGRGSWSGSGWRGFGLLWEPARPGNLFMKRWIVGVFAMTSIIALLIILRARREFGLLHASEARAIEASGNDWLSGLPNRLVFNHALERDLKALKDGGSKLALFYLDVDRFKDINDTFGLEAGDRMIQDVTARLEAVLTKGQSLARFEGDAFSILLPDVTAEADCALFAERIQTAMKPPFEIEGTAVSLSLSIGIAIAPDDAPERAELIRLANLALYRAKREGRDRLAFYKPDLHDEWRRRSMIEQQLRQAIVNGELVLRYQPIVDCMTGRVVGAEALVRWNHPAEGLISPDRFIEMAEDRGLILPLGEWVLREACDVATRWPDIRIAVNVSPIQLRQKDFAEMVIRVLGETGLAPSQLELELTEGILVDHAAEVLNSIAVLRQRGIRLAIDDFGTGYASLIYLRRLAVDKIKIDRAFVEAVEPGSDGEILLASIVKLGRDLGLIVTAEGIETAAQRDYLARIGCHQLQGYLISRPLRDVEFTTFLQQNRETEPSVGEMRAVA